MPLFPVLLGLVVSFDISMQFSINYGEEKTAEIICRFIVGCHEEQSLSALCAFLLTVVPYYPDVMLSAYKSLIDVTMKVNQETKLGRSSVLRVLNNLRVLLTWEATADELSYLKWFRLYPDAALGELYTSLFHVVLRDAEESIESGEVGIALDLVLAVSRLIDATAPNHRLVKMQIRYVYKLVLQLAALQRIALSMVCAVNMKRQFRCLREYRTTIFSFIHQRFDPALRGYEKLFLLSFLDELPSGEIHSLVFDQSEFAHLGKAISILFG
ncbi:hypothetical protein KIN20_021235, partial [Parelaphostrongylus tenuis]